MSKSTGPDRTLGRPDVAVANPGLRLIPLGQKHCPKLHVHYLGPEVGTVAACVTTPGLLLTSTPLRTLRHDIVAARFVQYRSRLSYRSGP
jgi:hypothetical protein